MLFINHIGVKIYEKQQILLCPNCWSCKFKNFSFYRIKFCPRWEILVYFSNPNFLVISSYYWNQSTNWQCFQQFWLHWLCFGFVSFVFMLDIYFSLKKLVLTKTNAIFPEKICCNFSYKIYSKVSEWCIHPDYDYLYIHLTSTSGKLQPKTNIFPGNNNPFSIKPTVVWVKISEKNHQFFRFDISLSQASK